jgi:hypothetical protein
LILATQIAKSFLTQVLIKASLFQVTLIQLKESVLKYGALVVAGRLLIMVILVVALVDIQK